MASGILIEIFFRYIGIVFLSSIIILNTGSYYSHATKLGGFKFLKIVCYEAKLSSNSLNSALSNVRTYSILNLLYAIIYLKKSCSLYLNLK